MVVVKVLFKVIGSKQLPNQPYLAQLDTDVVTVEVIGCLAVDDDMMEEDVVLSSCRR